MYNKRIDYDKEALCTPLGHKEGYLDADFQRKIKKAGMPSPEHIRKNLSVLEVMRKEGALKSPV